MRGAATTRLGEGVAAPLITPPPPPPSQTAPRPEPVKQEVIELGDDQYEETDQGHYEEGDGGDGGEVYSEEGQGYHPGEGAMVPHGDGEEGMDGGDGTQGFYWSHYQQASGETTGQQHICPTCHNSYGSKAALVNHQQSHEGRTNCQYCGNTFSSISNLNKHVKKHHTDALQTDF